MIKIKRQLQLQRQPIYFHHQCGQESEHNGIEFCWTVSNQKLCAYDMSHSPPLSGMFSPPIILIMLYVVVGNIQSILN